MAAGGDVGDELAVHVFDQTLEIGAFFRVHFTAGIPSILQLAGMDDLGLELGPLEQVAVTGPFHDDADGADDAGVVGVDLVGGRGDVVRAAGADAFNGRDDGLLLLVADAQDLVEDLLRGGGGAAGRVGGGGGGAGGVDVQDDGFDRVVLVVFAELVDGGIR